MKRRGVFLGLIVSSLFMLTAVVSAANYTFVYHNQESDRTPKDYTVDVLTNSGWQEVVNVGGGPAVDYGCISHSFALVESPIALRMNITNTQTGLGPAPAEIELRNSSGVDVILDGDVAVESDGPVGDTFAYVSVVPFVWRSPALPGDEQVLTDGRVWPGTLCGGTGLVEEANYWGTNSNAVLYPVTFTIAVPNAYTFVYHNQESDRTPKDYTVEVLTDSGWQEVVNVVGGPAVDYGCIQHTFVLAESPIALSMNITNTQTGLGPAPSEIGLRDSSGVDILLEGDVAVETNGPVSDTFAYVSVVPFVWRTPALPGDEQVLTDGRVWPGTLCGGTGLVEEANYWGTNSNAVLYPVTFTIAVPNAYTFVYHNQESDRTPKDYTVEVLTDSGWQEVVNVVGGPAVDYGCIQHTFVLAESPIALSMNITNTQTGLGPAPSEIGLRDSSGVDILLEGDVAVETNGPVSDTFAYVSVVPFVWRTPALPGDEQVLTDGRVWPGTLCGGTGLVEEANYWGTNSNAVLYPVTLTIAVPPATLNLYTFVYHNIEGDRTPKDYTVEVLTGNGWTEVVNVVGGPAVDYGCIQHGFVVFGTPIAISMNITNTKTGLGPAPSEIELRDLTGVDTLLCGDVAVETDGPVGDTFAYVSVNPFIWRTPALPGDEQVLSDGRVWPGTLCGGTGLVEEANYWGTNSNAVLYPVAFTIAVSPDCDEDSTGDACDTDYEVGLNIDPDVIHLGRGLAKSQGSPVVTAYITSDCVDVADIDVSTVVLTGNTGSAPAIRSDLQGTTLMVKFDKQAVAGLGLLPDGTFEVSGYLTDGGIFVHGADSVIVK